MRRLTHHQPKPPRRETGETPSLRDMLVRGRKQRFAERVQTFAAMLQSQAALSKHLYGRAVTSAADRVVTVVDPFTGRPREMVMFGSNNYLGLANHPYVRRQVRDAMETYGVGLGGPPLLNGYTGLHRALEERLAALKNAEAALLFPTGYSANIGLTTAFLGPDDTILYDALSHASLLDGIKMAGSKAIRFRHNDVAHLEALLSQAYPGDVFVGVEGVYSMDGDLAPLDRIVPLCKRRGAVLIVDDAHGTGVMGATGRGTPEHFGVEGRVDVTMGTFSKAFAVTGGFVAASTPLIDYLRYFARSHLFSASLPPVVVAAVLAGLDVMAREPARLARLRANIDYACEGLAQIGQPIETRSPILALRVAPGMNLYDAAHRFHEAGLFVNAITYPAVPENQQRFRISLMATHTSADIDRLLDCVAALWPPRETAVSEREKQPVSLVDAA